MATVTQSRSFPSGGTATYSLNGSAPVTLSFPLEARTQTTTSWRTGGGVDLQDGQLDTPSNEAGVFNYLVGEAASRDTNPYRPYDTGHEFSTVKQEMVNLTTFTSHGSSFPFTHPNVYTGPVVPVPIAGYQGLYPPLPGSFPDVGKFGLIAVNETAPTNPASSFGQGFGELGLDGTPTLPGSELKERYAISDLSEKSTLTLSLDGSLLLGTSSRRLVPFLTRTSFYINSREILEGM